MRESERAREECGMVSETCRRPLVREERGSSKERVSREGRRSFQLVEAEGESLVREEKVEMEGMGADRPRRALTSPSLLTPQASPSSSSSSSSSSLSSSSSTTTSRPRFLSSLSAKSKVLTTSTPVTASGKA